MPELSPTNKQTIDRLLRDYQSLSTSEQCSFPSKLKTAIIHYQDMPNSTTSAFLLCVAFMPMPGLLSEMDFSCLRMFYASKLFLASNLLNKANLLTGDSASDNFNVVAKHQYPWSVAKALSVLSGANLLAGAWASDNFNAVASHQDPVPVAQSLSLLSAANLLTGASASDNRNAVAKHQHPGPVAKALSVLSRANLLAGASASDNFNAVAKHKDPFTLAQSLSLLRKAKLLTGESANDNFNTIARHQYPTYATQALLELSEANLLAGESASDNFNAVAKHPDPLSVSRVFSFLSEANLLAGDSASDNRKVVATHQRPWALGLLLSMLNRANLLAGDLASDNFNAVARHQSTDVLYSAFSCFWGAAALNQINLTQLIAFTPILFGNEVTRDCWDRIPRRALTQTHITAIFDLCRQHHADDTNGRIAFVDYVNREVLPQDVVRHDARVPVMNEAQSTHTASVHQSISQSAIKLMQAYGTLISGDRLAATIQNILDDLAHLPQDTPYIDVAKRCLQRLIAYDYSFTDRTSTVSTKQLLALAWIAIHDDIKRTGTLTDAKKLFIEGLYDAQRGNNLSKENVDNEGRDASICAAGTFNKLMEKLNGIHADVEMIFITPATAALKLPVIVREEDVKYLASLANPSSLSECLAVVRIMQQEKSEGAEVIWPAIKDKVANRIFDEFGSLYRDAKDVRFLQLINVGIDVDLSEIPETFQDSIVKSAGFRDYCSQILKSHGFFASPDREQMAAMLHAKRNDSSENRRFFDMNFGMIQREGTAVPFK